MYQSHQSSDASSTGLSVPERVAGSGMPLSYAYGECSLGSILVAASRRGLCAILIGDDRHGLLRELQARFTRYELIAGDGDLEAVIAHIIAFIEDPRIALDWPLDMQGTAFQQRVWQVLRQIPVGETASYSDIAERIGQPKSVRAVAGACAANNLAVAIPCHRVVRSDGGLSGYYWGVDRKRELLAREAGSRKA